MACYIPPRKMKQLVVYKPGQVGNPCLSVPFSTLTQPVEPPVPPEPPVVDDPTHFVRGGNTASANWITSPTSVVHRTNTDDVTTGFGCNVQSYQFTPTRVGDIWAGYGTDAGNYAAYHFSNDGTQAMNQENQESGSFEDAYFTLSDQDPNNFYVMTLNPSSGVVQAQRGNRLLDSLFNGGDPATVSLPAPIQVRMTGVGASLTKTLTFTSSQPWWTGTLSRQTITSNSIERTSGSNDFLVGPYGDSNLEIWGRFPVTTQDVELGLTTTPSDPSGGRVVQMLANSINARKNVDPNGAGVGGVGLQGQFTTSQFGASPQQPPLFTALGGATGTPTTQDFGILVRENGARFAFLRSDAGGGNRRLFTGPFRWPQSNIKLQPQLRIVGNQNLTEQVINGPRIFGENAGNVNSPDQGFTPATP